jgi:uncharacterized protein (DUF433 family)
MDHSQQGLLERITSNPGIFGGKPIIRGMRFRVIDILEMMANGMSKEQIPYLSQTILMPVFYTHL